MDGQTIATIITGCLLIAVTIAGGFWKLGRAIGKLEGTVESLDTKCSEITTKIDGHGDTIGHLQGTVTEMDIRLHGSEKQLDGLDKRVDKLDRRINGWLNASQGETKADG